MAIILAAAAFRLWGLTWGLHNATIEMRPHPDEWTIYWLSQWFSQTGTLNPCPSPHQCFFDWGMGYLYLSYLTHWIVTPVFGLLPSSAFGQADLGFVHIVFAGRLLSALLSTLAVYVVYLVAREAFDAQAGLFAGIALALAALPIQLAHFATPDSTVLLLVSLTLFPLVRAVQRDNSRYIAVAGLPAGLAFGTEYHMILLSLPILAAWALVDIRSPVPLLVAGVAMIATYSILNAYDLIDLQSFLAATHHTLMIRTVDSAAQYQGRFNAYGPDWLYILRFPLGYGVGAAFALWYAGGFVWGLLQHRPQHLVLLAWILPYGLLISVSAAKFLRYSGPLMPALAVLAGGGAAWALARRSTVPRLAAASLLIVATLYSVIYDAAYTSLFTVADARVSAVGWLNHHVKPHSAVAFEQLPNGLINLPYFVSTAGYRPCFTQFHPAWALGPMRYLLTDQYAVEEHPRFTTQAVVAFQSALNDPRHFRVAARIHHDPSFLGITFATAGSPHDWRYPSRDITIYERVGSATHSGAPCYNSLTAAISALYPRPAKASL